MPVDLRALLNAILIGLGAQLLSRGLRSIVVPEGHGPFREWKEGDTVMLREMDTLPDDGKWGPDWDPKWDPFATVTERLRPVLLDRHPSTIFDEAEVYRTSRFPGDYAEIVGRVCDRTLDLLSPRWNPGATLVTVRPKPDLGSGVRVCVAADPNTGLAGRMIASYDAINQRMILRFDILAGFDGGLPPMTPLEAGALGLLVAAREIYVAQLLEVEQRLLLDYQPQPVADPAPLFDYEVEAVTIEVLRACRVPE